MSKLIIKNKYGITPNELLNNSNISLKVKGLYGYLQSKPDGWKFSEPRIRKQMREGRDAIQNTLKELEELGYLQRISVKNEKGRWDGYDYILYEKPYNGKSVRRKISKTGFPLTLSNKDNSNKDIVKKSNIIAKQSFAGNEINDLIELFKSVNPSYERLFGNTTQREAVKRLLKKYGREKLERIIKFLPEIFGKQYAPVITTPYLLESKMANLISYIKQNENKSNLIKL